MTPKGDIWPTPQQELLLRAALFNGEPALSAWHQWRCTADIDHLDAGSYRLLPRLYHNLQQHDVRDPWMGRLKGIHRLNWSKNHTLFHKATALLAELRQLNVEIMLLKGAALNLLYYDNYGLRPMDDVDILVHLDDVATVLDSLKESGWVFSYPYGDAYQVQHWRHSAGFVETTGGQIDLHWYVFKDCRYPDADEPFWRDAVSVHVNEVPVLALNPTDQLFHVCVHGAKRSSIPPFRWIADAFAIMHHPQSDIDWGRMVTQAARCQFALPLIDTSRYLRERFDLDIPSQALEELERIPVSMERRVKYNANLYNRPTLWKALALGVPWTWFGFLGPRENTYLLGRLLAFPSFLQQRWNLEHRWQVPFHAFAAGIQKIRSVFVGLRKY